MNRSLAKYNQISGVKILISSRTKLTAPGVSDYRLESLPHDSAVQLFYNIWGDASEITEEEEKELDEFIERKLQNHPLSIVLLASQQSMVSGTRELIELWEEANTQIQNDFAFNLRHSSMEASLRFTWNQIRDNDVCRRIWELFLFWPEGIEKTDFELLLDAGQEIKKSLLLMEKMSIIRKHAATGSYYMLQPMKAIRDFPEVKDEYEEVTDCVYDFYSRILAKASEELDSELYIIDHIRNLLYFCNSLIKEKENSRLISMHFEMTNYYTKAPYESLELLQEVDVKTLGDSDKASIVKKMGDLEMRVNQLEEAGKHYKEAEGLYRKIHADLGLANVLQTMGDLEMRVDQLEEAGKHYEEAEELYRKIHADLGLANVLQVIGDLKQRKGELEVAVESYVPALSLYEKVNEIMGKTYTLSELCYVYAKLQRKDEYKQVLKMLDAILDTVPYEGVKNYAEWKMKEAMKLLEEYK